MIKSIKILLVISGIVTIYTSIYIFFGTRIKLPHMIPYAVIMYFFTDVARRSLNFLSFFILFMFTPVLAATDFLCAYYIDKSTKVAHRVASYRALITCVFGIFPIIIGLLVFRPLHLISKTIFIEGIFYFIFYGTLLSLLMISERKPK